MSTVEQNPSSGPGVFTPADAATAPREMAEETVQASAVETPAVRPILVIDIGGTKVKTLATGQTEPRKILSGRTMTPAKMVEEIRAVTQDWAYEVVSIGYPGLVGGSGARSEALNLGSGWVGFDFAAAFGMPVRIVNDAAMQALGSYEGGRMLFLGFGTGLGSTLIADNVVVTLELGNIPYSDGNSLADVLGRRGFRRLGKKVWRQIVSQVVPALMGAFVADYVMLGGGNSKEIRQLPPGARMGHNLTAFRGGYRLWHLDDVPTLDAAGDLPGGQQRPSEWRLV
ncbi:MAG TPA: ROK family protein [Planctomycetaceae bacterium]|nr:ROK family protein [Planctomycetaceae bacterium]